MRNKTIGSVSLIMMLLVAGACAGSSAEREQATGAVVAMFTAVDARDWNSAQSTFAEQVNLDYTSMAGGNRQLDHRQGTDGRPMVQQTSGREKLKHEPVES